MTTNRISSMVGSNDWKTLYKTFGNADFQSYDYETLKKTFIDYLKTYYPESFNDYVDSSEYMALLDLIATMGQSLAYRNDVNTRENYIDTAERRDSVVKLAKNVGYVPKRNSCASGFLKIMGVRTSESLTDINGYPLGGLTVLWNDPANTDWRDQFNAILNAAMNVTQRVGKPANSQTILGVKTDEYAINLPSDTEPRFKFSSTVDGQSMSFEVVGCSSVGQTNVVETSPIASGKFVMAYRSDKLGYGSTNTGFFVMFKQGQTKVHDFTVDQPISNLTVDVDIQGINQTDVWVYSVDGNTHQEWTLVPDVYSTQRSRLSYSVTSRFNDQIAINYGDGTFADIPSGKQRVYVRSSNALQYSIEPSEIQNVNITVPYVSRSGRNETLVLTVSLTTIVNNAQTRESISDIKHRAPMSFYSQNRMINGEDYNNFPRSQFNSIIKSKSINRVSVGVSRNMELTDPSAKYASTVVNATDCAIYRQSYIASETLTITDTNQVSEFFATRLRQMIASRGSLQRYLKECTRYTVTLSGVGSYDNYAKWRRVTVTASNTSGYFFNTTGVEGDFTDVPYSVGAYTSTNLKYMTAGALVKFVAPTGYYFDVSSRLVAGIPPRAYKQHIWATVLSVVEDGANGGLGEFEDGTGPITLSGFVPDGAIISEIIPYFNATIPSTVMQQCVDKVNLGQDFFLEYDNSITGSESNWAAVEASTNYIIKFDQLSSGVYRIECPSIKMVIASENDIRFSYKDRLIIDNNQNYVQDTVVINGSNNSAYGTQLPYEITVNAVGLVHDVSGVADDHFIEVTHEKNMLQIDPDMFALITTNQAGQTSKVFFTSSVDSNNITRAVLISPTAVITNYATLTQLEIGKRDYPPGQVFMLQSGVFYITDSAYNLSIATNYSAFDGVGGLSITYRHITPYNARVNPSTSNIIDMFVVTQSYYDLFMRYVKSVNMSEPLKPSSGELSLAYEALDKYKTSSDSVIYNPVTFKPLFGSKAIPELQATIKVIKLPNSTVSDGEIKTMTIAAMDEFFAIDQWDFGETFYFSELSAHLHNSMIGTVGSVVLEPSLATSSFGDLYEITCASNEIFVNAATPDNVVIIDSISGGVIR